MNKQLVGNTHLIIGGLEIIPGVLSFLRNEGVPTRGNPDLYVRTYRSFGIDEARELRERAAARAFGARRVFVVSTPSMTHEAQNALLKTLEEPGGESLFFFIVPSPEALLPTLRSRAQMLVLEHREQKSEVVDVGKFLSALPQKRLELLAPLLEKGEDEKRDLGVILSFLSSIEQRLAKASRGDVLAAGLQAVYRARKYITDKGALVKPLLEQVALLVPHV